MEADARGGSARLDADERVVAESEVKQLKAKVRELERLLGKKTMEAEILKEGCVRAAPHRGSFAASAMPTGLGLLVNDGH